MGASAPIITKIVSRFPKETEPGFRWDRTQQRNKPDQKIKFLDNVLNKISTKLAQK
jgi:hypothetical protein